MDAMCKSQKELQERLRLLEVETSINKRWDEGWEHREDSNQLARELADLDWLFCSDSFGFRFGGDGDNGENLLYLLDILFDLREKEENTWFSEFEK